MTVYTPTEPEIEKALAFLRERITIVGSETAEDSADRVTLSVVRLELGLVDRYGFDPAEQVRLARAALAARERWAAQETKAA